MCCRPSNRLPAGSIGTALRQGARGVRSFVERIARKKSTGQAVELPLDVWGVIAGYLSSDVLCAVNQHLRRGLPRRHLRLVVTGQNVARVMKAYAGDAQLRAATLQCRGMHDSQMRLVAALAKAPALEELSLQMNLYLFSNHLGDDAVWELTPFKEAQCLRHLSLDLQSPVGAWGSKLSDVAAVALAELKDAPRLESLAVNLAWNDVGPMGMRMLMSLRLAPRLRRLRLDLTATSIGDVGAQTLACLAACTTLEELVLNLRHTGVSNPAAMALANLAHAPALKRLTLDLSYSRLGDSGLRHLVLALKDARHLETLTLNLAFTCLSEIGLGVLAELRKSQSLQLMNLMLGTDVTDATAAMLATLFQTPQLRSLSLDLHDSQVGDAGALSLAQLKRAPQLQELKLHLSGSAVTDMGASNLMALKECSTLETLLVDLRATNVGPAGVRTLKALRSARRRETLKVLSTKGSLCGVLARLHNGSVSTTSSAATA